MVDCVFDWADIARRTAKTAAQAGIAAFPVQEFLDLSQSAQKDAVFVAVSAAVTAAATFMWNTVQQYWRCRNA